MANDRIKLNSYDEDNVSKDYKHHAKDKNGYYYDIEDVDRPRKPKGAEALYPFRTPSDEYRITASESSANTDELEESFKNVRLERRSKRDEKIKEVEGGEYIEEDSPKKEHEESKKDENLLNEEEAMKVDDVFDDDTEGIILETSIELETEERGERSKGGYKTNTGSSCVEALLANGENEEEEENEKEANKERLMKDSYDSAVKLSLSDIEKRKRSIEKEIAALERGLETHSSKRIKSGANQDTMAVVKELEARLKGLNRALTQVKGTLPNPQAAPVYLRRRSSKGNRPTLKMNPSGNRKQEIYRSMKQRLAKPIPGKWKRKSETTKEADRTISLDSDDPGNKNHMINVTMFIFHISIELNMAISTYEVALHSVDRYVISSTIANISDAKSIKEYRFLPISRSNKYEGTTLVYSTNLSLEAPLSHNCTYEIWKSDNITLGNAKEADAVTLSEPTNAFADTNQVKTFRTESIFSLNCQTIFIYYIKLTLIIHIEGRLPDQKGRLRMLLQNILSPYLCISLISEMILSKALECIFQFKFRYHIKRGSKFGSQINMIQFLGNRYF